MEENFHELDPKRKISWIVLYCFLSAGISTGASEGVSECCNDIFVWQSRVQTATVNSCGSYLLNSLPHMLVICLLMR